LNLRHPVLETGALPTELLPYENDYTLKVQIRQDLVTFRDPETSRLKTSFHRKVSLQTATGSSHLRHPVLETGALPTELLPYVKTKLFCKMYNRK
jgi:hypothetical protein